MMIPAPAKAHFKTLQLLCLTAGLLMLNSCARQFSVSVNQNVLYDPRPSSGLIRVEDPGLQSCINVTVRQREVSDIADITVLACPQLEITSLTGLEAVPSLRFIDLAGNELETLDGLRRMERLTSVNAPDNQLKDISGILALNTLTSAVLTGNPNIPCDQLESLQQKLGQNLIRSPQCRR